MNRNSIKKQHLLWSGIFAGVLIVFALMSYWVRSNSLTGKWVNISPFDKTDITSMEFKRNGTLVQKMASGGKVHWQSELKYRKIAPGMLEVKHADYPGYLEKWKFKIENGKLFFAGPGTEFEGEGFVRDSLSY